MVSEWCAGVGFDDKGRKTLAHPDYTHNQSMWDHHANKGKLPSDFPHKSEKKVALRCGGCHHGCGRHHTWTAPVSALTQYRRTACPSCISNGKAFCVCQSVASIPKLLAEWHPSNPDATTFAKNSLQKFLWRCLGGKGHADYMASCNNRASHNTGCPTCAEEKSYKTRHPVISKGRPDLAEQWHPTLNAKAPTELTCGSKLRIWWVCTKRGHRPWLAVVASRALSGTGCPKCAYMNRYAPSSTKPRIFGPFSPEQHSQWISKP